MADLCDRVELARTLREIHVDSCSLLEIISPVIGTPLYNDMDRERFVPHHSLDDWSRFSDWKSADGKAWITDGPLYESFQLAFYLAFSSRGGNGDTRLLTQMLSRWSRFRLRGSTPKALPEYRVANRLLKTAIWGRGSRPRHGERRSRLTVPTTHKATLRIAPAARATGAIADEQPVKWVRGNQ